MEDENELQDTIFLDLNKIIPMPKEIEEITKYSDVNFIMQKRTPEQKKKDTAKEKRLKNPIVSKKFFLNSFSTNFWHRKRKWLKAFKLFQLVKS